MRSMPCSLPGGAKTKDKAPDLATNPASRQKDSVRQHSAPVGLPLTRLISGYHARFLIFMHHHNMLWSAPCHRRRDTGLSGALRGRFMQDYCKRTSENFPSTHSGE